MNLSELKSINRSALIAEITEKSRACAMIWKQIAPGQYQCTNLPFDFYISRTNQSDYSLDVLKNGAYFRRYNSYLQPEVKELYETVDSMLGRGQTNDRIKKLVQSVSKIKRACDETYDEVMRFGVVGGGAAVDQLLRPSTMFGRPSSLTFGPTLFPWSGGVTDIDDSPGSVLTNDADATYIRQEVSGAPPTQWGYAYVGFPSVDLPPVGPYQIRVTVVHRREANPGPQLNVDVVADSAVVFTNRVTCGTTYAMYDSGMVPVSLPSISNITVRLSMYSNTGNEDLIAMRVTAVNIAVYGWTEG